MSVESDQRWLGVGVCGNLTEAKKAIDATSKACALSVFEADSATAIGMLSHNRPGPVQMQTLASMQVALAAGVEAFVPMQWAGGVWSSAGLSAMAASCGKKMADRWEEFQGRCELTVKREEPARWQQNDGRTETGAGRQYLSSIRRAHEARWQSVDEAFNEREHPPAAWLNLLRRMDRSASCKPVESGWVLLIDRSTVPTLRGAWDHAADALDGWFVTGPWPCHYLAADALQAPTRS